MSIFHEGRVRVSRADTHAKEFISKCKDFTNGVTYDSHFYKVDNGELLVKANARGKLPTDAQLVLGEFFYQLRAALDATVWEAFRHLGGDEGATFANRLDFPICEKPEHFKSAAIHQIGLSPETILWIKELQPCSEPEIHHFRESLAMKKYLKVIHDCARKDRHRRLPMIGTYIINSNANIQAGPYPAYVSDFRISPVDFFNDEFEVCRFRIVNASPETEIKAHGSFGLNISVPDVSVEKSKELPNSLLMLRQTVEAVIAQFEAFVV